MAARRRRYPVFFAVKQAWVMLLDALPPATSQALTHHVQLRADETFRMLNHRQGASHGGARNRLARSPTWSET